MDAKEAKERTDAAYIAKELPRALHYIGLHADEGLYKCKIYSKACLIEPLRAKGFNAVEKTGLIGEYIEVSW